MGRVGAIDWVPGSSNQHQLAPALAPGQELQLLQRVLKHLPAAVVQKPASRHMLRLALGCLWLAATHDTGIAVVTSRTRHAYAADDAGMTHADPIASQFPSCFALQPQSPEAPALAAYLALTPDIRTTRAPQRLPGVSASVAAVNADCSSTGASSLSSGASETPSPACLSACKQLQSLPDRAPWRCWASEQQGPACRKAAGRRCRCVQPLPSFGGMTIPNWHAGSLVSPIL